VTITFFLFCALRATQSKRDISILKIPMNKPMSA